MEPMNEHLTFEAAFQERSREVYLDMHAQSILEQTENAQPQLEKVQARLKVRIDALRKLLDTIEQEYLESYKAEDTARRRSQGAKDGWEIRRAKQLGSERDETN